MTSSKSDSASKERRVAEITEEGVARLRERIGIAVPYVLGPHYRVPNEDAIRDLDFELTEIEKAYKKTKG